MPKDSEEFRQRMTVLGNSFLFLALRYSTKAWLIIASVHLLREHADYFLGPDIARLCARDAAGNSA